MLQTVLSGKIADATDDVATEAEQHSDRELVQNKIAVFGGRLLDSPAGGFLAAFEGPSRAVRCALALSEKLQNTGRELRAAIHSGECQAIDTQLRGLPIQIVTQMTELAEPSGVLVSGTVCDLVAGSGIQFTDRGTHALNDSAGELHVDAVATDRATDARPVRSVDDDVATLTPGPRDTMTPVDKAAVRLAKRAPALSRLGFRLLGSATHPRQRDESDGRT